METIKLYKKQDDILYYWQAWSRTPKVGVVNRGIVGESGPKEIIRAKNKAAFESLIQERLSAARQEGFAEAISESILVIEYEAEHMTTNKLNKLHRLGDHLDYLVGYTGLGAFDGNGFGFGKMDVSVTVVDFEIAKGVIAADLEPVKIYEQGVEYWTKTRLLRRCWFRIRSRGLSAGPIGAS